VSQNFSIYLAPFQGVTGFTFRSVYAKHFSGIDKFYTPFFTGIQNNLKLPARKLFELGAPLCEAIQVVPQILSKDAEEIIRFNTYCQSAGFIEVNWNLGCPFPQVADKKRGSGMLPYPEMVDEILSKVMLETSISFSIKCRLGYQTTGEIFELLPIFNKHSITELTVHARIGRQLYKGNTHNEVFGDVIPKVQVPLAYNGDIFSKTHFDIVQQQFPEIQSWMIGRGILYDPILPARIKGLPIPMNEKAAIRRFIDDLYFAYRKQMNDNLSVLSVLKEYWEYLSVSFCNPHQVFKKIKRTNNFDEYEDAVAAVFEQFEWKGSVGIMGSELE